MSIGIFTSLPLEITIDILSRLPIRSVISCKRVCKSWLELLDSHDFVKSHLSKSDPGLTILWCHWKCMSYEIYEFEDGEDLEHHILHYNPLTKFSFPHEAGIEGSANGLLFLVKIGTGKQPEGLYVCNPITCDYVEVHFPLEILCTYPKIIKCHRIAGESVVLSDPQSVNYGFGSSKITGQHNLVQIFYDYVYAHEGQSVPQFGGHVYTLGTGSWRPVERGAWFIHRVYSSGVLVNGHLHWIVSDSYSKIWISCFDLETEQFSAFSIPPVHDESNEHSLGLSALGDCLCLCDNSSVLIGEIAVWLMKDYGVEKSWSKEYVINRSEDIGIRVRDSALIYPLKFFEGGDILMLFDDLQLLHYSRETETAQEVGNAEADYVNSIIFTPSFLSVKSLGMDNVLSFLIICISEMLNIASSFCYPCCLC